MLFFSLAFKYRLIILFFISYLSSSLVFKPILKIAKQKDIVDNPNYRKLQKLPVPVMGGIAVFFGLVVGLCFYKTMISYTVLFPVLGSMVIMLYLGAIDDVLSISPVKRFLIEIIVSVIMLFGLKCCISDFQGLWGIDYIPVSIGIVLSIVTFLGVVNSINMIDGVDGLSASFCIMILGFFGIFCFLAHDYSFAVLSAVSIGALFPFFLHNLFGYTSKMFIGDGGTMMIGTAISAMVFSLLRKDNHFPELYPELNFSRVAFALAVLSIPIFDTIRVMISRILRHKSPFSPDNNHLHHLFLRVGFSNISIVFLEILLNVIVIFSLFSAWRLGASIEIQLYVTIAVAAACDFGVAAILSASTGRNDTFLHKLAYYSHIEHNALWIKFQKLIDKIATLN